MDDTNLKTIPAKTTSTAAGSAQNEHVESLQPNRAADEDVHLVCTQSDLGAIGDHCVTKELGPSSIVKHAAMEEQQQPSSNIKTGNLKLSLQTRW